MVEKKEVAAMSCLIIYVIATIYLFIYCLETSLVESASALVTVGVNFGSIRQVAFDWQTNPVSDVLVLYNRTTCPETHPELLLSRHFYGLEQGCDCRQKFSKW